jgi:hypothetical protein
MERQFWLVWNWKVLAELSKPPQEISNSEVQ